MLNSYICLIYFFFQNVNDNQPIELDWENIEKGENQSENREKDKEDNKEDNKPKRKSVVWERFDQGKDKNKSKCKHCGTMIKWLGKKIGSSSMKAHL